MKGFPKVLKTKEDYYNCLAMVASGELAAADLLAKIESAENQRYIECGVAAVEEEKKAVTVYYCDEAAVGMKFVAGDVSGTVQGVTHIQTDEAAAAGETGNDRTALTLSKAVKAGCKVIALERTDTVAGMTTDDIAALKPQNHGREHRRRGRAVAQRLARDGVAVRQVEQHRHARVVQQRVERRHQYQKRHEPAERPPQAAPATPGAARASSAAARPQNSKRSAPGAAPRRNRSWFSLQGADVAPEIARIAPDDGVAVMERVAAAAVIRPDAVDAVHPAGQLAAVKFVEVADALDIGAVVRGRPSRLHVDALRAADLLQHVKHRAPLRKGDRRLRQEHAIGRDDVRLAGLQVVHVREHRAALNPHRAVQRTGIRLRLPAASRAQQKQQAQQQRERAPLSHAAPSHSRP